MRSNNFVYHIFVMVSDKGCCFAQVGDNMQYFIGLHGGVGAGKSALQDALYLQEGQIEKLSFATPLKRFLMVCLGLTYTEVCGTQEQKAQVTTYFCKTKGRFLTGRETMQKWGDIFRTDDPDFFVTALKKTAEKCYKNKIIVIDDLRYLNESPICQFLVKLKGGEKYNTHESENTLDLNFDCVINKEEQSAQEAAILVMTAFRKKFPT